MQTLVQPLPANRRTNLDKETSFHRRKQICSLVYDGNRVLILEIST